MKNIIAIFALLLFANCQQQPLNTDIPKTMMLRASGEVVEMPDMASFRIELECIKQDIKDSRDCLGEKSNALNDQLIGFGIQQKDIKTTAVNMSKKYEWINRQNVFIGYRSSTTTIVTIRNIDQLSTIYTALLENKNLIVSGLNYTHSDMESLKNKAHVKALNNANALADSLLSELPEDSKEILRIGNVQIASSIQNQPNLERKAFMSGAAADYDGNTVSVTPGLIKVYATLFVEFAID